MVDLKQHGIELDKMSARQLRAFNETIVFAIAQKEREDFEAKIASLKDDISAPHAWVPIIFRHIMITACKYPPESEIRQRAFDAYLDALPHGIREWDKVVYDTFVLSRNDMSADERNRLFVHTGQNLNAYADKSFYMAERIMVYALTSINTMGVDDETRRAFLKSCINVFPNMVNATKENSFHADDVKRCIKRVFRHASDIKKLAADGEINTGLAKIFNDYHSGAIGLDDTVEPLKALGTPKFHLEATVS